MSFNRNKEEITMKIDPSMNIIIEQAPGSNRFVAMRNICWNNSGDYRLDIRHWYTDAEGNENPGKGFSFATKSGPSNLAIALIQNNYGDTEEILNIIKDRDDFESALDSIRGGAPKNTLYDPRSILV